MDLTRQDNPDTSLTKNIFSPKCTSSGSTTLALITGFQYSKNLELKSVIVDIYLVHKYCVEKGFKTYIITDIEEDVIGNFGDSILHDEMVTGDAIDFVKENLKQKRLINIKTVSELTNKVTKFLKHEIYKNLFFYYSGHGDKGYFYVTEHERIQMKMFREIIEESVHSQTKILLLIDSCDSFWAPLQYEINKSGQSVFTALSQVPPRREIVCICQAEKHSYMNNHGSVFTRTIMQLFRKNIITLNHLLLETNQGLKNSHCCKIYCSIYGENSLWDWVRRAPVHIDKYAFFA